MLVRTSKVEAVDGWHLNDGRSWLTKGGWQLTDGSMVKVWWSVISRRLVKRSGRCWKGVGGQMEDGRGVCY